MAEYKEIQTRIESRHDIEANWNTSTLIPLEGEVIIYDPDYDATSNSAGFKYPRLKVGDGEHLPRELLFASMPDVNLHLTDYTDDNGNPYTGYFLDGFQINNNGTITGSFSNNISGNAATADIASELNSPYLVAIERGSDNTSIEFTQFTPANPGVLSAGSINISTIGNVSANIENQETGVDVQLAAADSWLKMQAIHGTYASNLSHLDYKATVYIDTITIPASAAFCMELALGKTDWQTFDPILIFELHGRLDTPGCKWQVFKSVDRGLDSEISEISYNSKDGCLTLRIRTGATSLGSSDITTIALRELATNQSPIWSSPELVNNFTLACELIWYHLSDACIAASSRATTYISIPLDDWKALENLAKDGFITNSQIDGYLQNYILKTEKNAKNGVAGLNSAGKLLASVLPDTVCMDSELSEHAQISGDSSTAGHIKLYTADDCSTYTSEDGAVTPAAAKKAVYEFIAEAFQEKSTSITITGGTV